MARDFTVVLGAGAVDRYQRQDDPKGQDPKFPRKLNGAPNRIYFSCRTAGAVADVTATLDDGTTIIVFRSAVMAQGDYVEIAAPYYRFTIANVAGGLLVASIFNPNRGCLQ